MVVSHTGKLTTTDKGKTVGRQPEALYINHLTMADNTDDEKRESKNPSRKNKTHHQVFQKRQREKQKRLHVFS